MKLIHIFLWIKKVIYAETLLEFISFCAETILLLRRNTLALYITYIYLY